MQMKIIVGSLVLWFPALALADPGGGQDRGHHTATTEVKEILERTDQATKAVKAISYDFDFRGQGDLADVFPVIRGTLKARQSRPNLLSRLLGSSSSNPSIRIEARLKRPDSENERAYTLATNGKSVSIADDENLLFTYGDMPQAAPLLAEAWRLFMREFLHPTPFSDEINGKSAEHQGLQEIGDVECHTIYVVYTNDTEARWFFGTEDYLPRRVDRIDQRRGKGAATVLTLTNLDTAPALENEDFLLTCPSGFKKKRFKGNWPRSSLKSKGSGLLDVGTQAPNWKLKSSRGRMFDLESLRGNVVVMDFGTTWCSPCKEAMPAVQKLHKAFKGRPVKVLGLSCREQGDPAAYQKKKGYTYDLLIKADKVAEAYQVVDLPTFYIIDRRGRVIHASSGYSPGEEKKIAEVIRIALEKE